MQTNHKIWAFVSGSTRYRVNPLGKVQSCSGKGCAPGVVWPWRDLKQTKDRLGYPHVTLYIAGKKKTLKVHRLVAQAFIPNPENKPEVAHQDGNPSNPTMDNLRWSTAAENSADKRIHGTMWEGESNNFSKLTEHDVLKIKQMRLDTGWGAKRISTALGLPFSATAGVINYGNWKSVQLGELK